jgi:hypothetical protein
LTYEIRLSGLPDSAVESFAIAQTQVYCFHVFLVDLIFVASRFVRGSINTFQSITNVLMKDAILKFPASDLIHKKKRNLYFHPGRIYGYQRYLQLSTQPPQTEEKPRNNISPPPSSSRIPNLCFIFRNSFVSHQIAIQLPVRWP